MSHVSLLSLLYLILGPSLYQAEVARMGVCLSQTRQSPESSSSQETKYKWTDQNFFAISEQRAQVSSVTRVPITCPHVTWHVARCAARPCQCYEIFTTPHRCDHSCTLPPLQATAAVESQNIEQLQQIFLFNSSSIYITVCCTEYS